MSAITDDYGWSADVPPSTGYLTPAVLALAEKYTPRRILDAGCGNGSLTAQLALRGYETVGVDGDAKGIEIARQKYEGLAFDTADFANDGSEVGGGQFDMVVSTEVVEHLYSPHELPRFAMEALRPGGIFVVTTPYHGYLKNLALSLLDKWDHHHTAMWHGGHIKFWSRKTLTQLLQDAGFEVLEFSGAGRLPYLWMSMVLVARKPG